MIIALTTPKALSPTPYQASAMSVPEKFNIFLGGGRGGGKTIAALLLALRHVEQYAARAHVLVVRTQWKALEQVGEQLTAMLVAAYGAKGFSYNRVDGMFRLGSGATIELGQIDGPGSLPKYMGRECTMLVIDEAGLLADMTWVDLLKSNLRAPKGVPLRTVMTANPGGRGHQFLHRRYVAAAPAWEPYRLDNGETWVNCPSTFKLNPFIDRVDYEAKLRAACGNDEDLFRAWVSGDWNVAKGAYWAGVLREDVHMIPAPWPYPVDKSWRSFVAMDYGYSAPCIAYLMVRAPEGFAIPGRGDQLFPKGSLIAIDEVAMVDGRDNSKGLRLPPVAIAELIKERCAQWHVKKTGVADDAVGLEKTLLEILRECGLYFDKPEKARISGWAAMRERLHAATERNGKPGLYISAACRQFWETVPFLPRSDLHPDDVDTSANDHCADTMRYACLYKERMLRSRGGLTS